MKARKIRDPSEGEFLSLLNIYLDHCARAQKNFEDYEKNKGIVQKIKELLYGRQERKSLYSGLCGECFDCTARMQTLTETSKLLAEYRNPVAQLQDYCISEECKKAYKTALKIKQKFMEKPMKENINMETQTESNKVTLYIDTW